MTNMEDVFIGTICLAFLIAFLILPQMFINSVFRDSDAAASACHEYCKTSRNLTPYDINSTELGDFSEDISWGKGIDRVYTCECNVLTCMNKSGYRICEIQYHEVKVSPR
jgi:hypothetical protein